MNCYIGNYYPVPTPDGDTLHFFFYPSGSIVWSPFLYTTKEGHKMPYTRYAVGKTKKGRVKLKASFLKKHMVEAATFVQHLEAQNKGKEES